MGRGRRESRRRVIVRAKTEIEKSWIRSSSKKGSSADREQRGGGGGGGSAPRAEKAIFVRVSRGKKALCGGRWRFSLPDRAGFFFYSCHGSLSFAPFPHLSGLTSSGDGGDARGQGGDGEGGHCLRLQKSVRCVRRALSCGSFVGVEPFAPSVFFFSFPLSSGLLLLRYLKPFFLVRRGVGAALPSLVKVAALTSVCAAAAVHDPYSK